MIVTKLHGGLGNQMFQYAVARSIAAKTNDKFKLDLRFYSAQALRSYELGQFNIIENIASQSELKKLAGSCTIFSKVLRKSGLILRPRTYFKEKEITRFDRNVFERNDSVYLDGYWQNELYFFEIRDFICSEFTPKSELSLNSLALLTKIKNTNSVSIHVRRGDYVSNGKANNVHGTCSLEYYREAVRLMQKKMDKPKFFIFSDDIDWCKKNFDFINSIVFVDKTDSAIEDLELMKHCNHNIIANSSFSWWGAWLNQSPNKMVVSPKKWINHNPQNYKWACEDWLQL